MIQILHRRLGARNVLLQTDPVTKQVRAKLAGFGPLKGEQEGADGGKKVRTKALNTCILSFGFIQNNIHKMKFINLFVSQLVVITSH